MDNNATLAKGELVGRTRRVFTETESLNSQRYVSKYIESVNLSLEVGDEAEFRFESSAQRSQRLFGSTTGVFSRVLWLGDFFAHRVLPKLNSTKGLYFWLTKGKYRVLSETEAIGRLICASFDIVDETVGETGCTIRCRKVGLPRINTSPTYGPLVRLNRVGKDGKAIQVLKLRTMSPFSEYVQAYTFQRNGLAEGGKFADDPRVTAWGGFLRRFWLDELPMIWNFLRRDLKLVGVRPLSAHYLSLYPEHAQELRSRQKPGLLPPFYADMPKDFDAIVASEVRYMELSERHPIRTDFKYAIKVLRNIFFRRARSA